MMGGLVIGDPVSLTSVLSSKRIVPGDDIVLLPGVYTATTKGATGSDYPGKGVFRVKFCGTAENKITIRALTPGTVRINGGIELVAGDGAGYIILRDLEIAPTPTTRIMERAVIDYPYCVYVNAQGCEVRKCYLHDGIEGIAAFNTGGCVVADNIVINMGWVEEDSGGHGTGIYTHNNSGGEFIIQGNVFEGRGEHGLSMWSASINAVRDYICRYNTVFDGHIYAGCETGVCDNNVITDNHAFRGSLRLGRPSLLNGTATIFRNRTYNRYAALLLWYQRQANIQQNRFANYDNHIISHIPPVEGDENTVDNNEYFHGDLRDGYQAVMTESTGQRMLFDAWQATGKDVNSQLINGLPTVNEVFVYPREGGAIVTIWNWQELEAVSVDLSGLELVTGSYIWRQAQDPINDTGELEYSGDPLSFPMTGHTVVAPAEFTARATTFPTFGCFVVDKA